MEPNLLDDLLNTPFTVESAPTEESSTQEVATVVEQSATLITRLAPEHQEQAQTLAKQIDPNNQQAIITYGSAAQEKLGAFSHEMLKHVQKNDIGPIGDTLSELMFRLQESNPDDLRVGEGNMFQRMFGKVKQSIYEATTKYQKIGAQIDQIAAKLEIEKDGLIKDSQQLEGLYQQNKAYFDALNIYIAAGELKIAEMHNGQIPAAQKRAQETGDQMDVQIVSDLSQFVDRLEKRNYDLQLARQLTIQQAPQIRLMQNTNQVLAEKIQASITTAIPLWKNQVALALTLLRQKDAATAQRQVSDTTNELLKKNAEMLKISAIETARESERGLIDLETLQATQNNLIETIQETLKIQQEGKEKRRIAEQELRLMENNLKDQLLQISQ